MVQNETRRRVWGRVWGRVAGAGAGMGVPNPAPNPAGAIRTLDGAPHPCPSRRLYKGKRGCGTRLTKSCPPQALAAPLHLHHLSCCATPPAGLPRHLLLLSFLHGLAKPCSTEIYTINTTTAVVVLRSI